MWRFVQGIPRGIRGNLNGSVRQSAPQSVCRDEEKDGDLLNKFTPDHKGFNVLCKRNVSTARVRTIPCQSEWQEWKKAHFHQRYWKHQCQHCRLLEAVGWSSALLLGCKLSQLWKYKQARDERKLLAEYLLSRKCFKLSIQEPSLFVNYISDSQNLNGRDLESDVTWAKSPTTAVNKESVESEETADRPDSRAKQTPVAWAASEFPSLWGKPLFAESKFLVKLSEKLQLDSSLEDSSVETKDQEEDCCTEVEDLENLCNSIKYNREGNRFARNGDFEKAILCWKKASCSGSAKASFNLGLCYEIGSGVPLDKQLAVEYYTIASRGGSAVAAHNLALLYLSDSDHTDADVKKAEQLLRQASKQGLAEAQVELGVLCTEADKMDMAVHWFNQAAHQKDSSAEYYLGLCYENGQGVPSNLCKAADLFSRASKQGHPSAQFSLATFFEQGLGGLPVDKTAALELYAKSAGGGHSDAANHAARLDKELNKSPGLSTEENIGLHLKISASVPALSSYLKNHISQLGKLEWEWSPAEPSDCFHKASTLSDFRGASTEEHHGTDTLPTWHNSGDSENSSGLPFEDKNLWDSNSGVKFDLGESDSLADLQENLEDDYFSLSGQFGDMDSLSINNGKPMALHKSPSFDRLSSVPSESDESDLSIVFDDNFEGFRLVPNPKTVEKDDEPLTKDSFSGLTRNSRNDFSNFEMFDNSWSLNDMDSDLSLNRQILACN